KKNNKAMDDEQEMGQSSDAQSSGSGEPAVEGEPGLSSDQTVMDLSELQAYGGSRQNKGLETSLSSNNTTVQLEGNGWRKLGVTYTITPETMLSFEFRSDAEGDIHSIGFDTDNSISSGDRQNSFQLFGVQDWGNSDFATYVTDSGWQSFEIPVGDYMTGETMYLTLGNDHDVANPDAVSEFRNIGLFEQTAGASDPLNRSADILNPDTPQMDTLAIAADTVS
ncbi:MAG: hypothetical protein AAFU78_20245, partial [Cyanobacteria bacterium J06633_2]